MLKKERIVFVGAGNMGGALIGGLVGSGSVSRKQISAVEVDARKRQEIRRRYKIRITGSRDQVRSADIIVLAVKPQAMAGTIDGLKRSLSAGQLLISVAAGISTGWIERRTGQRMAVVRAMPNLPALVGKSATVIAPGRYAGKTHINRTASLLGCSGTVVHLPERLMDAVTAVSGSGPAYVLYLAEAMIEAGCKLGLGRRVSRELTCRTLLGTAHLLCEAGGDPGPLRRNVTSPGGTTEAAVSLMERRSVRKSLVAAIQRAKVRAGELARKV